MAAILLEMRSTMRLEQDLDVGVIAHAGTGKGMGDAVLADFDLAQLQPRDGGIVNSSLERGCIERVDIELAAKFRQRIGPALDLLFRRQS